MANSFRARRTGTGSPSPCVAVGPSRDRLEPAHEPRPRWAESGIELAQGRQTAARRPVPPSAQCAAIRPQTPRYPLGRGTELVGRQCRGGELGARELQRVRDRSEGRDRGRLAPGLRQGGARGLELPGGGAGLGQRVGAAPPRAQRPISSARQRRAVGDRLVEHPEARLAERDQVAGEVAAVHRRDVGRLQHAEIAQIVPVVEVAAEAPHPLERPKGELQPPRPCPRA